jgi:hypothetical protein
MAKPNRFKELERRQKQQERRERRQLRQRNKNRQRRVLATVHMVAEANAQFPLAACACEKTAAYAAQSKANRKV